MLYSEEYQKQQEALHENPHYGKASIHYAPMVSELMNKLEVHHLLDYGAGKCNLGKHLKVDHKFTYQAYDPGVPELAGDPVPAEMVACIDVLEHIEPDFLENVLDHLEALTEAVLFCTVCTAPAKKTLPDGRNAHLIVRPIEWWLPKIMERFDLQACQVTGPHTFYVLAYSKAGVIEGTDGQKL